jgi:hypothetical protein
MKVVLKTDPAKFYVVYGVYWAMFNEKIQRHHFVIEHNDGLAGFSVLCEDEVNTSDPSLTHFVIHKDDYGMDMLIHKAAFPSEVFFSELVNHDDFDNIKVLFKNMRELNLEV